VCSVVDQGRGSQGGGAFLRIPPEARCGADMTLGTLTANAAFGDGRRKAHGGFCALRFRNLTLPPDSAFKVIPALSGREILAMFCPTRVRFRCVRSRRAEGSELDQAGL
jgi:hypothetical protein